MLTDFQFFIEILVVYKDYLDPVLISKMKQLIKNKSCSLSSQITEEITRLFGQLPKQVRLNLPDDFYHIRHNTLICSNDQNLADERINLMKSMYGKKKKDKKIDQLCEGRRDGNSGCRDCCRDKEDYDKCLKFCMAH